METCRGEQAGIGNQPINEESRFGRTRWWMDAHHQLSCNKSRHLTLLTAMLLLFLCTMISSTIVVAEASRESFESRLMGPLRREMEDNCDTFINSLKNEFYIHGPNSRHLHLASDPAACSIADSKEASLKIFYSPYPTFINCLPTRCTPAFFHHIEPKSKDMTPNR